MLGNHAEELTRRCSGNESCKPSGAIDLGGKVMTGSGDGLILAGIPGSPRYCEDEPAQYSEWEIGLMTTKMAPRLHLNRLRHGRALDLLVSHAPPRDVNDRPDPAHRGFEPSAVFSRSGVLPTTFMGTCTSMTAPSPSSSDLRTPT